MSAERRSFEELAQELTVTIRTVYPKLSMLDYEAVTAPLAEGKWSCKQIVGHLVDSASYNHHRFLRTQLHAECGGLSYDQDGCVRLSAPGEFPWPMLLQLWMSYNLYLAHILAHVPESAGELICQMNGGAEHTLRFLAEDYLRHLNHHLQQMDVA
jgi:hypothetical protein